MAATQTRKEPCRTQRPPVSSRARRRASCLGAALLALVAIATAPSTPAAASATSTITLDSGVHYQTIDGFGTALVDQLGSDPLDLWNMAPTQRQQILNLLFDRHTGAGLSIMRFELGAGEFYLRPGYTIEPASPGSPAATPSYQWDHSADHQVWLAQQAKKRGVKTFYADAWSAPAFMKTNDEVDNGGDLCGESPCISGDWRQAYANYLVQYLKDYASDGITPTYVDPMNEPDYAASWQSMTFTPAQATDFVKVLGATLAKSGLPTRIACCDDSVFGDALSTQNTILADNTAASYEAVAAAHGYGGDVTAIPAASARGIPTWQTEYSCASGTWNTAYSTGDCDGQYWADRLYTSMSGGASAYLSWTGDWSHTDNEDLIRNFSSTTYQVSSRLWAMANYSRYVRPGAVRIGAYSSDSNMLTTAYRNTDGSYVIVIDNHNTASKTVSIAGVAGGFATPYVTDDAGGMQQQPRIPIGHSGFSYNAPPNSTVTLRLQGTTGTTTYYSVVNRNSGLVLSVDNSSTAEGASVIQWPIVPAPAQQWQLVSVGTGSVKLAA